MRVDLKRLRAALAENKRIKLLSLLMAIISWHMIRDAISLEVVIPDVPLQIMAQTGMAVLNQSAATVDVTFRGSQEDIQRLDPRRIQAVVELREAGTEWSGEIDLSPAIVHGVRGARAVAVHPPRVQVALDRQAEKRLPVKGRTVGTPLFGEIESITCEPGSVVLRGPEARLRTTESVYTQPVDVDGRVESFTRRAALQSPGDNWVAQMDPAEVQVRVAIVTRTGGREWKAVPVKAVVDPGQGVTIEIEPSTVDVTVMGSSNVLARADVSQVRAFADCTGLAAPGTYTVPVRVHAGSAEASARPEAVSVTLNLK